MEASQGQSSDLNRPTPYHCEVCHASFANEGALRSHQKLQHGEAPDPLELQVPWVPWEPMVQPYGRRPTPGTEVGIDEGRPDRQSDERLPLEPTEPGGSEVNAHVLPREDLDPTPVTTEMETATPISQKSESARRSGHRSLRGRRPNDPTLS
jgi:Zinc-finger of C2H2 type